jgi:hypothetical protein
MAMIENVGMIELPTVEFVGALNDVIPFASTEKDDPAYNVIRLEWDGETMYTLASNRHQHIRYEIDSRMWQNEPDMAPYSVRIALADAKMLASAFKLPTKHSYASVGIAVNTFSPSENLYRVTFSRDGSPDYSRLALNVFGRGKPLGLDEDLKEVDIHSELAGWAGAVAEQEHTAWSPKSLANFGKVERHGAILMEFMTTKDGGAVRVSSGPRFQGIAYQTRTENKNA